MLAVMFKAWPEFECLRTITMAFNLSSILDIFTCYLTFTEIPSVFLFIIEHTCPREVEKLLHSVTQVCIASQILALTAVCLWKLQFWQSQGWTLKVNIQVHLATQFVLMGGKCQCMLSGLHCRRSNNNEIKLFFLYNWSFNTCKSMVKR